MSEGNVWSNLGKNLVPKAAGSKPKAEVTSNLEELFKSSSLESYALELKKAILMMERNCPKEINTPFKGNCLEITASGKYFIFGSIEGRLAVIEKTTKEILHDLLLPSGSIYTIALYGNDLEILAAGKDGIIRKFDFANLEETRQYIGHTKEINSIVLSADEQSIFSASDDCTVRSWSDFEDASTVLYTHDKAVLCLARSKDGKYLISGGSDKKVKLFDLEKSQIVQIFSEFTSSVWTVVISANNRYLAAGDSNAIIKVWDFASMEIFKTLVGHTKRVSHLEFTASEKLLISSSNDCTLRVWDLVEEKNETIMTGHTDWVKAFKLSADEKNIYSIAENFKILVWVFPKFDSSCRVKEHNAPIISMCYSRSQNFLFTCDSLEIKVWSLESKSVYKTLKADSEVSAMCMSHEGTTLIAAYTDKQLVFWNIDESVYEVKIKHPSIIRSLIVSPDGRYIVCGDSNFRVTIYNRKSFQPLNIFRRHNSVVTALTFGKPEKSENDQMFSGGEDNAIFMYSIRHNKSYKFSGHASPISYLAVSRDNDLLISGDYTGCFKIWHIKLKNCIRSVETHTAKITGIYFSENSKYFWISSEDSCISLWNSTSFTEVTNLKSKYPISCFVITKNEAEIITCEYEEVHFMGNPLRSQQFYVYGPGREYYSFMRYIVQICEGVQQKHDPEMDKWIITPFEINALHFYAYFNLPQHLKSALQNNSPFYFSKSGYSPIQIALHRNFRDCINVIIKSIRVRVETDPFSVGYLEDSIVKLNELGFKGLDNFYHAILFRAKDKLLPKFCEEESSLPILVHSRYFRPQIKDFFSSGDIAKFGVPLSFWQSALRIDVVIGSKDSIVFLESIVDSPNTNIFRTQFVQELVSYKWKYIKWTLLPQFMVYGIYILVLSYYMIFLEGNSLPLMYGIFAINILLACYAVFQMGLTRTMYLKDYWNHVDIVRITVCFMYCIFTWVEFEDTQCKRLLVGLTFVSMVRGISYFRMFDNTRYMINLLSEVFKDMFSFIVLLTYSTFSFALIYFIMVNNVLKFSSDIAEEDKVEQPFYSYLTTAYLLNLGDFNTDGYGLFEWIIFFCASVINPLIMMNLLISIMGDTYGRVKEEQEIADMKELTKMVIEGEYLLFCKRHRGRKTYMQICKEEEVCTVEPNLEEKIYRIKQRVKNIEGEFVEKNEAFKEEIKDTVAGLNSKLDEMTTLIEQISFTQE